MKTDQISVLQSNEFVVEKTRDYSTIISSTKPFNIHGDSGVIAAPLNEQQKYVVVFAGFCSNGKTPYLIEQSKFPMIAEAHQHALQDNSEQPKPQLKLNEAVCFDDLVEGENFSKSADQQPTYRKVSETTYVKTGSLVESLELVASHEMAVYVTESNSLTMDQKQMIVDSLPDDLQRYDFDEVLGMTLENIAGVENMTTHAVARLHKELYKMYVAKHSHI